MLSNYPGKVMVIVVEATEVEVTEWPYLSLFRTVYLPLSAFLYNKLPVMHLVY